MDWFDLAPYWDELKAIADGRDRQKSGYSSSRYWNRESHFHGLLGEQVYGASIGMEPDKTLRALGDGGIDFPDTDVKTSTFWNDPWLKVPPTDKPVGKYPLVALDIKGKRGYVACIFYRPEVGSAPLKDWGHGPMLSLPVPHEVLPAVEQLPLHNPGRCYFEAPTWSPFYQPHVTARRADGSEFCGTCHPMTVPLDRHA